MTSRGSLKIPRPKKHWKFRSFFRLFRRFFSSFYKFIQQIFQIFHLLIHFTVRFIQLITNVQQNRLPVKVFLVFLLSFRYSVVLVFVCWVLLETFELHTEIDEKFHFIAVDFHDIFKDVFICFPVELRRSFASVVGWATCWEYFCWTCFKWEKFRILSPASLLCHSKFLYLFISNRISATRCELPIIQQSFGFIQKSNKSPCRALPNVFSCKMLSEVKRFSEA